MSVESDRSSRFMYHAEAIQEEGGVHSLRPPTGERAPSGAPAPDERLLDISELARTVGMRYKHRFELPIRQEGGLDLVAPQVGEITLTNTGALLVLRGSVQTRLRLECGRCLEPTEQDVEAELEEDFDLVTSRNAFHQDEVQAVDEDTPAAVIKGNVLDLGDLLRQNLLLAAPLQPLCREDCPGIDLGERNVIVSPEEEPIPIVAETPLRNLAQLLDAKRAAESNDNKN